MKYTTQQIETIASNLRKVPAVKKLEKQQHSKQEAIKILSKEIISLQKRGYTLGQVSEMLRGDGLDITTPTLKNYLQRALPISRKTPVAVPADMPSTSLALPEPIRPASQENKKAEAPGASVIPRQDTCDI